MRNRTIIETKFKRIGAHVSGPTISSAVVLSDTAPANAKKLLMQAITQNIRYTLDGTTPTSTVGFQLRAGDPPVIIPYWPGDVTITVIEETSGAKLQYQWGS